LNPTKDGNVRGAGLNGIKERFSASA